MALFLGIDPGLASVGFGVVEGQGDDFTFVDCGVIKTPAGLAMEERLLMIKKDLDELLKQFKPDAVGVEELFFAKNVKNAIAVAHVRGVILERVAEHGVPLFELTPLQLKNNICGYGQADKKQVQEMVKRLLHLKKAPHPDDAADALGIAIYAGRVARFS
ncbi:MAG: crossover junction endodeoxyribonuclease RuvC [Candidatus Peregrinibacteria bacterium]